MLNTLWILLQIIVGYNLALPFVLVCLYKVKSIGNKKTTAHTVIKEEADYGIIVTAYEQTNTLPAVIASLLKMNYTNYLIYIVADKCDISNLKFKDKRVIILHPDQTLGSNTRSHFYAIKRFRRAHERLTIIDSDNLVATDYLQQLNVYFDKGYAAVQGVRKAKNLDTTYSCLDAARDIYYHFYDGEVLFGLGSSATLAGSGMAFTTALYKECLEKLDVSGAGFDKVLQYEIVKRKKRIAFAKNAIVFDEKTSQSEQLVKQRARWINTWFRYFSFGFKLTGKGIQHFNWNQLLFGCILLRPPLFMFIILSGLFTLVNLFINPIIAFIWIASFVLFLIGFIIPVVHEETDKRIYKSLVKIPMFMFYQVLSLLKVKKANSFSVATQHYHSNTIEEITP
ncbi:glycosyltransferase family 2 protein [Ilyomonas limi]|uniref:Glycosyltransferase family 2 protein n=1 Tax=Ilyomonas limi TaxID=2575867 RepID=A0A4U3KSG4_9BACT|nr:glycosyltransferase [Ilyomonas limi]TKK65232.1 glycosyltransferase family 2 protein [Ilyomonas limi]